MTDRGARSQGPQGKRGLARHVIGVLATVGAAAEHVALAPAAGAGVGGFTGVAAAVDGVAAGGGARQRREYADDEQTHGGHAGADDADGDLDAGPDGDLELVVGDVFERARDVGEDAEADAAEYSETFFCRTKDLLVLYSSQREGKKVRGFE